MKMVNMVKRQEGVSLLEAMLFLVIAAIVLMVALRYFTQSNEGQKINNAYDQHMGILSAQAAYTADGNAGDTTDGIDNLITKGYLSNAFKLDPWGGTNTLAVAQGVPTITSTAVPQDSCDKVKARISSTITGSVPTCASNTLTVKYGTDSVAEEPAA